VRKYWLLRAVMVELETVQLNAAPKTSRPRVRKSSPDIDGRVYVRGALPPGQPSEGQEF
jgi:hypothetical protein